MATSTANDKVLKAVLVCTLMFLVVEGKFDWWYDVKDGRHSIELGQRKTSDVLIISDNPRISGSFLMVKSYDVCYPRPLYDTTKRFTINSIRVTNLMPPGKEGYVFITDGGLTPDKTLPARLCLHLKSQRGEGYNFNIEIYGTYQ